MAVAHVPDAIPLVERMIQRKCPSFVDQSGALRGLAPWNPSLKVILDETLVIL